MKNLLWVKSSTSSAVDLMAAYSEKFPLRNPVPADNRELMELWFKHCYLVYLQRIQQGGAPMGTSCSCTLGIQPNVYAQLPAPQQAQITEIFRAAERAWT